MAIYLFSQILRLTKNSIKPIEKLSRRLFIDSFDVFNLGFNCIPSFPCRLQLSGLLHTGIPTKDETSETIVRNLYWLFSYTVLIFVNNPVAMGTTRRPNNLKSQWIKVLIKKVFKNTSDRSTNLSRTFLAFFFPIWNEGGETIV